jgi:wyosine [tRNA(Phe)-imidazoG37] synthetase (radical SAM superfamily)
MASMDTLQIHSKSTRKKIVYRTTVVQVFPKKNTERKECFKPLKESTVNFVTIPSVAVILGLFFLTFQSVVR